MKREPLNLVQRRITHDDVSRLKELVANHEAHVRLLNSVVYGRGDEPSVHVESGSVDEMVLMLVDSYGQGI